MRGATTKTVYGYAGAALVALALWAVLWIEGSAIVLDRGGQVDSAVITNGAIHGPIEQRLYRLPFGIFYAIPRLEGMIEVRCRDGSRKQLVYVAGYVHVWRRIGPDDGCS